MKTTSNRWRALWARLETPRPHEREWGQTTAEYALVLLAVAAVALALTTWASGGKVGSFLDAIFSHLLSSAT